MSVTIQQGLKPASGSGGLTLGTYTATTSGSTKDFTGLPSTTKQIIVNWNGVSTGGGSDLLRIRIGTGGSFTTTGYVSQTLRSFNTSSPALTAGSATTSFLLTDSVQNASDTWTGTAILTLVDSSNNRWQCIVTNLNPSGTATRSSMVIGSGLVSLAGTIDRIQFGTDGTFDAGNVNIAYI